MNPLGPPSSIGEAIATTEIDAYPDATSDALRASLSNILGITMDHILVGNGTTELIHALAQTYLGPRRTSVVLGPTCGDYAIAARKTGASVFLYDAKEEEAFVRPLSTLFGFLRMRRAQLVFLANPNDPTGVHLSTGRVLHIGSAVGHDGLLVVDEAHHGLADQQQESTILLKIPNVVLLRSFSNDFSVPGIRLGYLVARPTVVNRLRDTLPNWNISTIAQAAGLAAVGTPGHVEAGRLAVQEAKTYLYQEIAALGLHPMMSAANFLLVKVGDSHRLHRELLKQGFNVLDCSTLGLPSFIRIGVRRIEDCRLLIEGLAKALA